MSNPAGVHNAIKMREMFIKSSYRVRLDVDCEFKRWTWKGREPLVAILSATDHSGLWSMHYYFKEDGTYYRGSN